MAIEPKNIDRKEILKQAILKIEELQLRLRQVDAQQHEPIAVIGAGCRMPGGGHDLESFWQNLIKGVDAVDEIPHARWDAAAYFDPDPDANGKMYTRHGAFLSQVDQFDARFFNIAPREAAQLDPQQRLLLEVVWEALEMAGQAPELITGSATGVFIGMTTSDYAALQSRTTSTEYIDTYFGTGVANSIASGRIAYVLGLRGPCMTVDTACSSSLVALHLACQSLHAGECRMALAGGVSLILAPDSHIIACKGQMLSRDGRCKTFDAAADGYGRGEGCGVVVLKRLSDAKADGDPILGLILGSAINHDGKSAGLTAPNGIAQEEVMRKALLNARVVAADVGYIETHGTGTVLGDPIEIQALGAVYNAGHTRENPLLVGSVKTNVGHLEAAAGIAGLLKVLLMLRHAEIPPHLHFKTPNPHIPWESLPIEVATRRRPWPDNGRGLIAGLSSFGFSGTNAHFILQGPPALELVAVASAPLSNLLALSAKSREALVALAAKYVGYFDQRLSEPIDDACFTANTGRAHFNCRLAVIGKTAHDLREGLLSFSEGISSPWVLSGETFSKITPPVAMLFTGQGSQAVGMGRTLYETQPVFRNALERCHEALRNHLDKPLLDVLYPAPGNADEARTLVNQTVFAQPLLFAVEYALSELWKSWGLEPAAVMGHSVGEYVAACVAGVFSLEDGLRLIAERGKRMQALPQGGTMAAIFTDQQTVEAALGKRACRTVCIAAINSPLNTVIAGPDADVAKIVAEFAAQGIGAKNLPVSHAFHSPLMAPMLSGFQKVASTVRCVEPRIDLVSNVSGKIAEGDLTDAAYWCRHVSEPVKFMESIKTLYSRGYRLFLEVGPQPTLLGLGIQCLQEPDCVWVPSLRKGQNDWDQMLKALGLLYTHGMNVNWHGVELPGGRRKLSLPTYPFQRERHWVQPVARVTKAEPRDVGLHPLLGRRVYYAKYNDIVFESVIDTTEVSFVLDHRFSNIAVVPATAYLEMGQAAAAAIAGSGPHWIEDFNVESPLMVGIPDRVTVQTVVEATAEHEARFDIYSLDVKSLDSQNHWKRHAGGRLLLNRGQAKTADEIDWPQFQKRTAECCAEALSSSIYYQMLHLNGVDYGPAFQGLEEIRRGDGEAIGRIRIPSVIVNECQSYHVHPAVLDTCFQLLGVAFVGKQAQQDGGSVYMPMGVERYTCDPEMLQDGWIHGAIRGGIPAGEHADQETFVGDVQAFNRAGKLIVQLKGIRFKRAAKKALQRIRQDGILPWLYELTWQELDPVAKNLEDLSPTGKWLILCDHRGMGHHLADQLANTGQDCILAADASSCNDLRDCFKLDSNRREDFERLFTEISSGGSMALEGIIYLPGLDSGDPEANTAAWEEHPDLDCSGVLNLLQAMSDVTWTKPPRLILITCGATVVGERINARQIRPQQAALWGLGRVIATEHPEFGCKLVDLDPTAELDEIIRALAGELGQQDVRENQIALRRGCRFTLRLVRSPNKSQAGESATTVPAEGPYRLEISSRGVIGNLELQHLTPLPPGPGEVQIHVEATGLNFRDVLNVLGMYPGDPGALGNECVGRIASLGPGVQGFEIGEPVLALAPRAFCSHVNVKVELLALRPETMSVEEAATIPITFLTAMYALHHLARIQPGERILIHAGAGGVGMAAIQLAQRAGAEIFATAGSTDKRALLKKLGVQHVMDSRTLAFSDQIAAITANQGIDIVLNSLTGEFIPKSLSLLRAGGRFLELGKTDLWDQARAEQLKPGVTFIPVFLGDICQRQPALVQSMFQDIMQGFAHQCLRPLPHHTFPLGAVKSAFRFMAQAKHVGKVVVDQRHAAPDSPVIHENATYLITGGLGSLGLHFADLLAKRGARHLVLLGRRQAGVAALDVIKRLKASGMQIVAARCDVANKGDLQRIFDEISSMPPLKGIIHAAGVVDDGMLLNQSPERFAKVMAPKTIGSWLLHEMSRSYDLDFFVLCSAGAALFGSPGQGNYAAANAFMDALAHYRCSLGLPALSINWGPWAKSGMAADLSHRDHQRWAAMGMAMIEPAQGLNAFEVALTQYSPQVAVLPINWPVLFLQFAHGSEPLILSSLARSERKPAQAQTRIPVRDDFLGRLEKTDLEDRYDLLMEHVRLLVASVLGLRPSVVLKQDEGLTDLGMDSLMAVEFRNRLNLTLKQNLPSTLVFEYPTIKALTDHLAYEVLEIASRKTADQSSGSAAAVQDRVPDEMEHLDDEAVATLLTKELDSAGY